MDLRLRTTLLLNSGVCCWFGEMKVDDLDLTRGLGLGIVLLHTSSMDLTLDRVLWNSYLGTDETVSGGGLFHLLTLTIGKYIRTSALVAVHI